MGTVNLKVYNKIPTYSTCFSKRSSQVAIVSDQRQAIILVQLALLRQRHDRLLRVPDRLTRFNIQHRRRPEIQEYLLLLVEWPTAGVFGLEQQIHVYGFNLYLLSFVSVSSSYVKISHEAKLQTYVKMQMLRNQPRTFRNRRIYQELNNST